jgi:hypothetical protein
MICAKFISKKIRKIRWKPRDDFGNPNPEYFVAGSWDDPVSVFQQSFFYSLKYYSNKHNFCVFSFTGK